jgi:hypothetical protein
VSLISRFDDMSKNLDNPFRDLTRSRLACIQPKSTRNKADDRILIIALSLTLCTRRRLEVTCFQDENILLAV